MTLKSIVKFMYDNKPAAKERKNKMFTWLVVLFGHFIVT